MPIVGLCVQNVGPNSSKIILHWRYVIRYPYDFRATVKKADNYNYPFLP